MYYKKSKQFRRLESRKCKKYNLRNILKILRIFNCRNCIFYVCFLIMSVVIVKASAVTIYQNRTPTEHNSKISNTSSSSNNILSQFQATTSEFITTKPDIRYTAASLKSIKPQTENLTITNHIIRTNIIVGGGGGTGAVAGATEENQENRKKSTSENMRAKLQQLLQREQDDDEEKKQLQYDHQQQQQQQQLQEQQYQQQQQQQQHHHQLQQQHYQPSQHAILSSENAYLLERIDGGSMHHEQPIYGTWNAKARRPQAPLLTAASATPTATAAAISTSSVQPLMGEIDENYYDRQQNHNHNYNQNQNHHHHYERLPRRSSTMTPVRRELHDQIPRPPRLTSRQPSMVVRRQFIDTPMPTDSMQEESRPQPFHFPFDGPMPEEFKKLQQQKQKQQSERGGGGGGIGIGGGLGGSNDDVNNIQDILQKLNLAGSGTPKVPPLMMMPTGLHISGSYKNLKSSGLANFFRGKRNKKQIQLQFPMPMQMMSSYPQPIMHLMPQTYQQRITMDHIYPFKPRSPNDINLLAMQQHQQQQQHHQQQQQFKKPHSKGKKHKKKQKDKKNILASSNLMLQQYPFATSATDVLYPGVYPPYMAAVNVTQAPLLAAHQLSKRVPFKVNLDIFPVMPPSKNYKNPGMLAMDEARIVSSMRPPTALRNPFMEYFTTPITPTATALNYYNNAYNLKQPVYNPIRFPTGSPNPVITMAAQTNNVQLAGYPEQIQKYLQQQHQQQQQQHQQHLYANFLNNQGHQTPFLPIDCDQPIPASSSASTKSNPIMVHLNVFPKQKPSSSTTPISTNPFYSNIPHNVNRNTIQEESESSLSPIEPRHQGGRSLNDTSNHALMKIARSDSNEDDALQQQKDLLDFEHPIVAGNIDVANEDPDQDEDDVIGTAELPQPLALQGSNPNMLSESSQSFYYDSRPNNTMLSAALSNNKNNTNYNLNLSGNLEQMASEAKTASLFRFPVEDLIQFQVHDAM